MNITFNSLAFLSPSSVDTCLKRNQTAWVEAERITRETVQRNDTLHWAINVPFVWEICFVSYEHDNDISASLCPHIINPFRCLLKWIGICRRNRVHSWARLHNVSASRVLNENRTEIHTLELKMLITTTGKGLLLSRSRASTVALIINKVKIRNVILRNQYSKEKLFADEC